MGRRNVGGVVGREREDVEGKRGVRGDKVEEVEREAWEGSVD